MIAVGLTGNVAGGKTTVADWWREEGVRVIDADRLGHEVLAGDAAVQEELVKEFGGGILGYDGRIDRELLGRKAFADPENTRRLNAIVHPPLLRRLDAALEAAEAAGEELVVVDAALVFEFHLDEVLDRIVLVTAPPEIRARRLRETRRLDPGTIERIMDAQMADDEKLEDCDYVIENDGSLEELRARADAVLRAIRGEIGARDAEEGEG